MNMISNNDNKAATSLRTLERGLRLLELLAEQPNGVTVKQLASRSI
jgi:hypothetical protein